MLLSDYISQVQELVHDSSGIDYTTAELTNFINNARKRVALDFHCVRNLFIDLTTVINQETYPISGGVGGAEITAGGLYAVPPTVTFGPPGGGGTTATGTPVMTGTAPNLVVSSIAMTNWGSGYTAVPTVTFSSGAAAAIAAAMVNVIDIMSISKVVNNQRTMLQWKVFTLFQAVFRSNTALAGEPCVWSNYTEQNTFYIYPALPDQNYEMEIDAVVLPNPLVLTTDADLQILDPPADCVQFYAAHLALLKLQNFEQAEYMHKKYKARVTEIQITKQGRRISNVYQTVWRRLQRGY